MNKIEKISDDKKYYSEDEFVEDIIKKVNETIEVLNNLLSEPRTLKLSLDDAKKIKKELKNSKRELQLSKIIPTEDEWKEELRFLYGDLYYRNEDGEFCRIINEIDDLIDFIKQLLSKMYTKAYNEGKKDTMELHELVSGWSVEEAKNREVPIFTKEELETLQYWEECWEEGLEDWGITVSEDDNALKKKISKLLKKKGND